MGFLNPYDEGASIFFSVLLSFASAEADEL